jgi:hypothetical protein
MKDFNIAIEALSQYVRDLSTENLVLKDRVQLLEGTAHARTLPPLTAYMNAETTPERDIAYLRLYAAKVRDKTETTWEIPNTRAATLEDIATRAVTRLRREVQLRALIQCFAKHPSSCPKGVGVGHYVPPADAVCSCGIDEAINP